MNGNNKPTFLERHKNSLLFRLMKSPTGAAGLIIVLLILIVVIFAPNIATMDYAEQHIRDRLQGPSGQYILGTDTVGRDLFSRLIYGTRIAIFTAIPSVLGSVIVGIVLGLIAGYFGGTIDNILLVIFDTIQAFPSVILALALLAILGSSMTNVILVIIITYMPGYARVTRASVMMEKAAPYVEAEKAQGVSNARLLFIHILPNIIAPIFVMVAMDTAYAITMEAGLSFLGLGVQPPTPSWGIILSDGFQKIRNSAWPVIWASLFIMVSTLGFTMLGESLRDILDPKLSGSRG